MAITIISSPDNYRFDANSNELQKVNDRTGCSQALSDTIKLDENDYKLTFEDKYKLNIELTNARKSIELTFKKNAIIRLSSKGRTLIAKGNPISSSFVPPKCDLFFTVGKDGKILLFEENKISFKKVGY